jgi:hypothetical protein
VTQARAVRNLILSVARRCAAVPGCAWVQMVCSSVVATGAATCGGQRSAGVRRGHQARQVTLDPARARAPAHCIQVMQEA